jgi:SPP1 gp7 family putative phage head morphogenesis protein
LVDANTVKNLATQDKTLLPYKYIDGAKAERWHTQRVNAEVLQGVLQGESIPKIAKRLRDNVGMSARGSAVRNARTAVTSAENKGRMDMLHDAEDKGVKAEKGWLAAHDARVRESHAQVDGEFVGIDDEFSNGLQFPGDPDGAPEEVYNCRCTLTYKVIGFKSANIEDNNAYKSQKVYEQIEETPPMNEYEYWSEAEDRKRFNAIKEQTGFDDDKAETTLRAFSGNRADYHGVDNTPEGWFYRADRRIRKLDGEKWSNAAQTIDEYIEAAPKFDGTIYRGMSLSREKIDAFQQGGIFQDNGSLSSWTSSLDVAQMFAEGRTEEYGLNPVIIKTASHPHSTPVAHLSLFGSDENEVLVSNMHGNEYKIDSIEKRDGVLFVRLIFGG